MQSLKFLHASALCVLATIATILLFPSCKKQEAPKPDVIVLHTARLRGNIYPTSLQSIAPLQHYQYIAGYVRSVREEAAKIGADVLLIDLGDSLEGSFATHATGSQNVVAFFNALNYDAILLGNLDGTVPLEALNAIKAPILTPFESSTGAPVPTNAAPFAKLQTASGLQTLLLANYYGNTLPEEFPDRFPQAFGAEQEGVRPIRDFRKVLAEAGAPAPGQLVLFAWQKFEAPAVPPAPFLEKLRSLGVDAILAHRVYGRDLKDVWSEESFPDWNPPVSQNILRDNGGFTLARLDLKKTDGGKWQVLDARLVPMTANYAPSDQKVLQLIEQFAPAIQQADLFITKLSTPLDEERVLQSFLTSLTLVPESTAVAYSRESVRAGFPAGELRASAIFNALPWTTPIVQLPVTPAMLDKLQQQNPRIKFWKFMPAIPAIDPLDETTPQPSIYGSKSTDEESAKPTPEVESTSLIPAEPPPFLLTTSLYFARIFASQMDLPLNAIKQVGPSEFDYYLDSLSKNPDLLEQTEPPEGWQPVSHQLH